MSFILQKALPAQTVRMRGKISTIVAVVGVTVLGFMPEAALARENVQVEIADCPEKVQRKVVRPLAELTPIRKKDRVRRILM